MSNIPGVMQLPAGITGISSGQTPSTRTFSKQPSVEKYMSRSFTVLLSYWFQSIATPQGHPVTLRHTDTVVCLLCPKCAWGLFGG